MKRLAAILATSLATSVALAARARPRRARGSRRRRTPGSPSKPRSPRSCTSGSSASASPAACSSRSTIPPADAPTLIAAVKLLSPTPRRGARRARPPGRARVARRRRGARRRPGEPTARITSSIRAPSEAGRRPIAAWSTACRTGSARRSGAPPCRRAASPPRTGSSRRTTRSTSTAFHGQYAKAVTASDAGRAVAPHGRRARRRRRDPPHARRSRRAVARARRRGRAPRAARRGPRRSRLAVRADRRARVRPARRARAVADDHAHAAARLLHRRRTAAASPTSIARSYFSPNTLPAASRVGGDTQPRLARPPPALPARLNLMAASRDDGTTLRDQRRHCLARYRVEHGVLAVLARRRVHARAGRRDPPRGRARTRPACSTSCSAASCTIAIAEQIAVSGKGLGAGTVEVLVEDERGVRTSLGTATTPGGREALARVAAPRAAPAIVAVFRGTDTAGEPIVAVGAMPLAR